MAKVSSVFNTGSVAQVKAVFDAQVKTIFNQVLPELINKNKEKIYDQQYIDDLLALTLWTGILDKPTNPEVYQQRNSELSNILDKNANFDFHVQEGTGIEYRVPFIDGEYAPQDLLTSYPIDGVGSQKIVNHLLALSTLSKVYPQFRENYNKHVSDIRDQLARYVNLRNEDIDSIIKGLDTYSLPAKPNVNMKLARDSVNANINTLLQNIDLHVSNDGSVIIHDAPRGVANDDMVGGDVSAERKIINDKLYGADLVVPGTNVQHIGQDKIMKLLANPYMYALLIRDKGVVAQDDAALADEIYNNDMVTYSKLIAISNDNSLTQKFISNITSLSKTVNQPPAGENSVGSLGLTNTVSELSKLPGIDNYINLKSGGVTKPLSSFNPDADAGFALNFLKPDAVQGPFRSMQGGAPQNKLINDLTPEGAFTASYNGQPLNTGSLDELLDQLYYNNINATFQGRRVDVNAINARAKPTTLGQYQDNVNNALFDFRRNTFPEAAKDIWKRREKTMANALNGINSPWRREGNNFQKFDSSGNTVTANYGDSCAFLTDAYGNPLVGDDCGKFLWSCVLDNALPDSFSTECLQQLANMKINLPPTTVVRDIIKNVDPWVAFEILRKLGFTEYLDTKRQVAPYINVYKVCSVDEWLKAKNERECCKSEDEAAINAMKNLRRNDSILDYLEILVQWVNANPQALNPEINNNAPSSVIIDFPEADKRFNIYRHVPSTTDVPQLNLNRIWTGVNRMIQSSRAGVIGCNGPQMMQNVQLAATNDLNMPFLPSAFRMSGGAYNPGYNYPGYNPWASLAQPMGYDILDNLYKALIANLKMSTESIQLSRNSRDKIENKIREIADLEEQIRDKMEELEKSILLARRSNGRIDTFDMKKNEIDKIYDKQFNVPRVGNSLQELSLQYNNSYNKVLRLFQNLASESAKSCSNGNGFNCGVTRLSNL